jgi:hypothetical protein
MIKEWLRGGMRGGNEAAQSIHRHMIEHGSQRGFRIDRIAAPDYACRHEVV